MEFIDKVESTIETLEELDNFYSKLGNNPEFSHIVDAWPQEGFNVLWRYEIDTKIVIWKYLNQESYTGALFRKSFQSTTGS